MYICGSWGSTFAFEARDLGLKSWQFRDIDLVPNWSDNVLAWAHCKKFCFSRCKSLENKPGNGLLYIWLHFNSRNSSNFKFGATIFIAVFFCPKLTFSLRIPHTQTQVVCKIHYLISFGAPSWINYAKIRLLSFWSEKAILKVRRLHGGCFW